MMRTETAGQEQAVSDNDSQKQIPIFHRGAWTTGPYPISGYDDWDDYTKFKRDAGYEQFTGFGEDGTVSLGLDIWHGAPQAGNAGFLVEIHTPCDGETVGAVDVADLMDLLARWAPTLQVAVVSDLWEDSRFDATTGVEYSRVANIGALLAEGAERRDEWASRQRQDAMRRREEARARKAQREAEAGGKS
jgi:hypothetical protein